MKSIRSQLTLRLLAGGILLLGAAGIALHWQIRRALTAEFDTALSANAQSLASMTEQKDGRAKIELSGESTTVYGRTNGSDVFLIRNAGGREIARSTSLGGDALSIPASGSVASFEIVTPDGRHLRCTALRFTPKDEEDDERPSRALPGNEILLIVGRDRQSLDHTLAEIRASLIAVGVGALAILAALVRWGVRGGLSPLNRLGEQMTTVDANSLSTRFASSTLPTELSPITDRLNELLARLESSFSRERRFTATAAHELRTPLAELRSLAEVNLTTPATEAERVESWRDSLATTLRMESLSLSLLELARAEDPARALHLQTIRLAEALDAAWEPWKNRAAQRHIDLIRELPNGLTVHSDPALLGVILGNLCSNAAGHAPIGTPLRVTATGSNGFVTIHFRNQAAELTAADLPHLFERFWRKDASRTDASHHGLGLALAAEFASLLGGTLSARFPSESELEFSIRLPTND